MSGFTGADNAEGSDQFAFLTLGAGVGNALTRILLSDAIVPGESPSYSLCKDIYAYHPVGSKMAEAPINMAQSQERDISIPVPGEERLVAEFRRVWDSLGDGLGADGLIKNVKLQSRIYGIASLVMGDRNKPAATDEQVDWAKLHEAKPYFNIMDPLNTAGSLVLDQDPNSPDFQKPVAVRVAGRAYHRSRTLVVINEPPIYILWSDSAFGFSGRSVYQRALYPMKTLLQSMVTDQLVTLKCGLLVYKANSPGSIQNKRILGFFGWKRSQLKAGVTGQVLNIGTDEDIVSLNFQNLEGPASFARNNALKNIAMAASMPAKMLEQEELVEGLAEGTEDAKQIARFIDRLRIEMNPEYAFFDRVTQRLAWTPDFYKAMQRAYPDDYGEVPYETAFYAWLNAFTTTWPNLLAEPESKQIEVEKTRFESVVALLETLIPAVQTRVNKAAVVAWAADEVNAHRKLFSTPLTIDEQAEAEYEPPAPMPGMGGEGGGLKEPAAPPPFSSRT